MWDEPIKNLDRFYIMRNEKKVEERAYEIKSYNEKKSKEGR